MEGDRILAALKSKGSCKDLERRVKNYLQPLHEQPATIPHLKKYEDFCLKLLKQCVEFLSGTRHDAKTLLNLSQQASTAYCIISDLSTSKISLFAKLLLNLAKACLSQDHVEDSVAYCQMFQSNLCGKLEECGAGAIGLLKHVSSLLWCAAAQLSRQGCSQEHCLQVRKDAVQCMLSSKSCDLLTALDYAMKAEYLFTHSTLLPDALDHLRLLYSFHTTLFPALEDLTASQLPCEQSTALSRYLLHHLVLAVKLQRPLQAQQLMQLALHSVHQHRQTCGCTHCQSLTAQTLLIQLWKTVTESPTSSVIGSQMVCANNQFQSFLASSPSPQALPALVDATQLVMAAFMAGKKSCGAASYFPSEGFCSFKALVLASVECLDSALNQQPTHTYTRQLRLLSSLATILKDLLGSNEEDIEMPRDASHTHTPQDAIKNDLVDACLPILHKCQDIINKGKAVLPVVEHKWLGYSAHLLACCLKQDGLFQQACPVLQLSCDHLLTWCLAEQDVFQNSVKSELLERLLSLVELYGKLHDYPAAVDTLATAVGKLPIQQLQLPATINQLAGGWVWLKNFAVGNNHSEVDMIGRSFLCVGCGLPLELQVLYLEEELSGYKALRRPLRPALMAVLQDLLSLNTRLHCSKSCVLAAHYTVQLASIRYEGEGEGEEMRGVAQAEALLEEAVSALRQVEDAALRPLQQQALASAHLWQALISFGRHMSRAGGGGTARESAGEVGGALPVEPSEDGGSVSNASASASQLMMERVKAICLSEEEQRVMCADTVTHALSSSVEAWQEVWLSVRTGVKPLVLEEAFHYPLEMLDQLLLTAQICSTHSQAELAIKALCVLLHLSAAAAASSLLTCTVRVNVEARAWALLVQLLVQEGGVAPVIPALEAHMGVADSGAALHSALALAEYHLSQGELSLCQSTLLWALDKPLLSGKSSDSLLLCARAKLLASRYLLHKDFQLKPSRELLAGGCGQSESPAAFHLSPLELAIDAVKLLWHLSDRKRILHADKVSGSCLKWNILLTQLQGLHMVAHLLSQQNLMSEAYCYAREGAMLAKAMHLRGWYCEFLLVLLELFVMRGCPTVSSLLSSQLTLLLRCSSFLHTLTLTSTNTSSPSNADHTPSPSTVTEGPDQVSEAMKHLSVSETSSCDADADILQAFLSSPSLTSLHLRQTLQLACMASHHSPPTAADVRSVVGLLGTVSQFLSRHSDIDLSPVGVPPLATPTTSLPGSKGRGRGRRGAGGGSKECIVGGMSVSSVRLVGVVMELACARARYLLAKKEPVLTQQLLRVALEKAEGVERHGYQFSLLLAKLHHYMGVALAQQLEDEAASDGEVWFRGGSVHQHCLEQFLCSYQLCFPVMPTILLRETCLWLALLLPDSDSEHSHHFLALSQHISLSHQTVLSLGKKLRSESVRDHVQDVRHTISQPPPPASATLHSSALLRARQILFPSSRPLPPCHAHTLLSHLPQDLTLLTISLAPKPHPSSPPYTLLSKASITPGNVPAARPPRGRAARRKAPPAKPRPLAAAVHVEKVCGEELESALEEFRAVLKEASECVTLQCRRQWWAARRSLNTRLHKCLDSLQSQCLEDIAFLSSSQPLLLILGRHLHQLPWECLPALQDTTITRTPSLNFVTAHKVMASYQDKDFLDVESAYFVVNPQGDLKKTEKLFGQWFSGEEGWEGVVGKPPSTDRLSVVLQEKDMYIYCGHSAGRFLANTIIRSLHLRASAFLMGCNSAELEVDGECDPSGHPLTHLLAGCPAVVGCLWSVTDGEIDRFCQSLVTSLLSSDHDNASSLPQHVNAARAACKLSHLVGSAPVVYGLPLIPRRRQN